ncbi:serine hydrolase domain-containing protein [Candidatus Hydrogenedentota bacterium]
MNDRFVVNIICKPIIVLAFATLLLSPQWAAAGDFVMVKDRVLSPGTSEQAGLNGKQVEGTIRQWFEEGRMPGAVYLVARQGRIVAHGAVGWADIEKGRPMHSDTVINIASTSKAITGTAMMILWDEGKFAMDDPVGKYIPAFINTALEDGRKPETRLTIRHLFTHTHGIPELLNGSCETGGTEELTLKEGIEKMASLPLLFPPGSQAKYSGLYVVAYLIQEFSGMPCPDFLKARLFDPLGMSDTYIVPPDEVYSKVAQYHGFESGKWIRAKQESYVPKTEFEQTGATFSTTRDLAVFLQMALNGGVYDGKRILSPEAVAEMCKILGPAPHYTRKGIPYYRGAAWAVGPTLRGIPEASLTKNLASRPRSAGDPQRFFWHLGGGGVFIFGDHDADLLGVFATQITGRRQDELRTPDYVDFSLVVMNAVSPLQKDTKERATRAR